MNAHDNHLLETIKAVLVPIHRAGYPFIAGFAIVSLLLSLIWEGFGFVGLVLTLWCVYFFRDPERFVPTRAGLVVSPGDGVVQMIVDVVPPEALGLGNEIHTRISIFLNVFDVHVNRIPAAGKVSKLTYIPGLFLNASLDKASEDNERQLVTIDTYDGAKIGVVQIAGLVARRILCDLKDGQEVKRGERFGLIRFGSRVDVYLPKDTEILALVGQRAVGGETVLAQFTINEHKA
jgi:phosphatidylserine decarboxylase